MADGDGADVAQLLAELRAGRRRRRRARATASSAARRGRRRRGPPAASRRGPARGRPRRSSVSTSTTWAISRSASSAIAWPCGAHTSVARSGHDERRDDVGEAVERLLPDVDLDALAGDRQHARRPPWPSTPTRRASSACGSTAHEDRARRVEAADLLEAVLDLAAVVAVADDDEVEHARGLHGAGAAGGARRAGSAAPPRSCSASCRCADQTASSVRDAIRGGATSGRRRAGGWPPPGPASRPRRSPSAAPCPPTTAGSGR